MLPGPTFRLEPPRLRTTADPGGDRHSTWFELFLDLVFVAAVAQLGAALARDPSGVVFARFAGLFVIVAWAWYGFTIYANRFDTDDLIFRLAESTAMLAIAGVAVNLHRLIAGHGGTEGFAAGYAVVSARSHVPRPARAGGLLDHPGRARRGDRRRRLSR